LTPYSCKNISTVQETHPHTELSIIFFFGTLNKKQKQKAIKALFEKKIESRPLWKPMHLQEVFKDAEYFGDKTSEKLFEKGICLPSGTKLTKPQVEKIANLIKGK